MTDVYVAISQELITIPASTVLCNFKEESTSTQFDITSPATESSFYATDWLAYIILEVNVSVNTSKSWTMGVIDVEFCKWYEVGNINSPPFDFNMTYSELGDYTGFTTGGSEAITWGYSRCILQGAYDDTGYSKETSILNEILDEPIDLDIETIATASYVINTGYDKSEDLSIWTFSSKWLPSHKRQWVKDFIHAAIFGKVDSEIISIENVPEFVYKFFKDLNIARFKLFIEKTERPKVDKFEKGLIQFTLALLEVPQ